MDFRQRVSDTHPFGCAAGSQFHPDSRFHSALFSSRTVGFPESGWRRQFLSRHPFLPSEKLKRSSASALRQLVISAASPLARKYTLLRFCVRACRRASASAHREFLCTRSALPLSLRTPGADWRTLPRLHRSYELMRQTVILLSASVVPIPPGLRRLFRVSAA